MIAYNKQKFYFRLFPYSKDDVIISLYKEQNLINQIIKWIRCLCEHISPKQKQTFPKTYRSDHDLSSKLSSSLSLLLVLRHNYIITNYLKYSNQYMQVINRNIKQHRHIWLQISELCKQFFHLKKLAWT